MALVQMDESLRGQRHWKKRRSTVKNRIKNGKSALGGGTIFCERHNFCPGHIAMKTRFRWNYFLWREAAWSIQRSTESDPSLYYYRPKKMERWGSVGGEMCFDSATAGEIGAIRRPRKSRWGCLTMFVGGCHWFMKRHRSSRANATLWQKQWFFTR